MPDWLPPGAVDESAGALPTPSRARSRSAIHVNSCRRRRKNRRWPKPANGSSRHQELHHLLELPVSVAETREIDDPAKREELLQAMAHGSAAAWGHLNLLGEYDFSEDKLQDSVGIKPPKLTD